MNLCLVDVQQPDGRRWEYHVVRLRHLAVAPQTPPLREHMWTPTSDSEPFVLTGRREVVAETVVSRLY
ncbi:hypothetical protein GCM10023080_023940 [Streptomyces pseudoechinosporeus]